MDKETKEFYEDLLQSVREMKENRRAKEAVIPVSSAGQYYQSIDFGWDEEFWLFAVVGYLYELDRESRSLFDFHLHVIPHSEFNGNQFITGIDLWKK